MVSKYNSITLILNIIRIELKYLPSNLLFLTFLKYRGLKNRNYYDYTKN